MTRDCWEDFAVSGRVSDYLRYRQQACHRDDETAGFGLEQTGGMKYEPDDCSDRYGIVGHASGGL